MRVYLFFCIIILLYITYILFLRHFRPARFSQSPLGTSTSSPPPFINPLPPRLTPHIIRGGLTVIDGSIPIYTTYHTERFIGSQKLQFFTRYYTLQEPPPTHVIKRIYKGSYRLPL